MTKLTNEELLDKMLDPHRPMWNTGESFAAEIREERKQTRAEILKRMAEGAAGEAAPQEGRSWTFNEFQSMNAHRCSEGFSSCAEWTEADWALAIAGEAGELCNILKKIRRGDFTVADRRQEILKELADIITYCDLLNSKLQANTAEELVAKFNEVSKRMDWPQIPSSSASTAGPRPGWDVESARKWREATGNQVSLFSDNFPAMEVDKLLAAYIGSSPIGEAVSFLRWSAQDARNTNPEQAGKIADLFFAAAPAEDKEAI